MKSLITTKKSGETVRINKMSYKNKVKASSFLAWYFSDSDTADSIGRDAIECMRSGVKHEVTARGLFDACMYIPQCICEVDGDDEYDPSEVLFIDDLGKEVSNG
jgi:hypothetical protein